ncbi:hypothetical protein R84B8_00986 [Treponema sp. R8-4-B8]
MKKTIKFLVVLLVLITGTMLFSCASVSTTKGYADTLEEAHPDRIEKTVVGISTNEFKSIWPEATRSGISETGEIYEFVYTRLTMGGYAYTYKIYTKFYFSNDKLVRYESTKGM